MDAVDKTVDLLEFVGRNKGEAGVREIALATGISKSSAHRILRALVDRGWLEQDPETQKYRLGFRFVFMVHDSSLEASLARLCLPYMQDAVGLLGETAILAVMRGTTGVCIERVESDSTIKLVSQVGKTLPLHAGASGKILAAYMPETELNRLLAKPLVKYTARTITDPLELTHHLQQIRHDGYAISEEEVDIGAAGVAAPVFGPDGRLLAGLNIAGPKSSFEGRWDFFITETVKAASVISGVLARMIPASNVRSG